LKKVLYTPHWQDGQPTSPPSADESKRTPQLIQVVRLESYEDTLHNVVATEARGRAAKKGEAARASAGGNRYRLTYLLHAPLEASDSMLNLEKLEHPFSRSEEHTSELQSRSD